MKIISGGQTGADVAGLKEAKKHGLETGGNIPKGCLTRDGFKPEYLNLYGMKETTTSNYPTRTMLNVKESDCTIWFGENRYSAGKLCTYKHIKKLNKPSMDIDIDNLLPIQTVTEWIDTNKFETINIAGNSETKTNRMEQRVGDYLDKLFSELNKENDHNV